MRKYGNRKTEIDGYTFDSLAEARRYSELLLLVRNGDITNLEVHPDFPLVVNDKKIGKYIADFAYVENDTYKVEDVKGVKTAVYQLKKKLVKAIYGLDIVEVTQ